MNAKARCGLVIGMALLVSACSTNEGWRNRALAADAIVRYDGADAFRAPERDRNLVVVVSFSGGGSRAAAFAHAVVRELDAIPVQANGRQSTLAREIDMVTGVSGGSVAAAHLAMYGVSGHLARFESDFLARDFQRDLILGAMSPSGAWWLASPTWGRGHHLAKALDEALFQGLTFGDLAGRTGHPYLIVGATDVATGAEFDFASDQFRLICSSIDDVPLAFAVAASSAVPLLFSPLTLENHAARCAPVADAAAPRRGVDPARDALVADERARLAAPDKRYIHLVDGGVSDNLGLRRIADYVPQAGGIDAVVERMVGRDDRPLSLVFIGVDAERRTSFAMERSGTVPSATEVLSAMINGGLGRYSSETALVFSQAVAQWERDLRRSRAGPVSVRFVNLRLAEVADSALRERVLDIPTAFRISASDRDDLRQAAALLVDRSIRTLAVDGADGKDVAPGLE